MSILAMFLSAVLPFLLHADNLHDLTGPVDALSVQLSSQDAAAAVRYKTAAGWSEWQELYVENEQDPAILESNLVMFPPGVTDYETRGDIAAVHPITVSDAPATYRVAAVNASDTPRILTRPDWGAEESLRYRSAASPSSAGTAPVSDAGDNGGGTPSVRQQECSDAQLNYPDEFKTTGKVTREENGEALRWAHSYSKTIKLIAVHHTAVQVNGDARSGVERIRALYQYHAVNRGWGDIGYHYLIDEEGQIYEGKAGGKFVVGGHAYCNNVGTLGVALLGNFEVEKPTQDQLKALQWLLNDLAEEYDIDPAGTVKHHGKTLPTIVGHRDLLSTDCPGYYVYGAMAQVRTHVASGDLYASVTLPKTLKTVAVKKPATRSAASSSKMTTADRRRQRLSRLTMSDAALALRRKLGSNPGREVTAGVAARRAQRLSGSSSSRPRSRIAITRSSRQLQRSSASSDSFISSDSYLSIRIRLTRQETGATSCSSYDLSVLQPLYRGTLECTVVDGIAAIINEVSLEDYMMGLAEEPDTEPYEKQRAFAIAARTYAVWYLDSAHRKFPGKPYDGSDSPATFQMYSGKVFEAKHPRWVEAVKDTAGQVLLKDGVVIKPPYFSSNDGRTRSPAEAGWKNFPFAEIFASKDDPWCIGQTLRGHGVGMSGCGAEGQANEGKTGEEILRYYYPGTTISTAPTNTALKP